MASYGVHPYRRKRSRTFIPDWLEDGAFEET